MEYYYIQNLLNESRDMYIASLWHNFEKVHYFFVMQVAEVLGEDRTRLSISGWFHGPPIERPPPYIEKPRPLIKYGDIDVSPVFL